MRLGCALAATFWAFALCWSGVPAGAQAPDRPRGRIVLVTHKPEGFRNAFWDALRGGGKEAARAAGLELEYRGVAASFGGNAAQAQDAEIRKAVDGGAAGILVTPIDRYRLVPAVKYAVLKDVPVVSIDSAVESNLVAGIVATNGYEGGLAAAQRMAELLGGTGAVVMLGHPARENRATLDRERSFAEGLQRFAPGIRLLGGEKYGDATIDGDRKAALDLIRANPELRGAYAVSGSGLVGFLRALKETGKAGSVALIGWDADAESLAALQDGTVRGIMQQDPETMARRGVELLVAAMGGVSERRNVGIPATLITAEDLGAPEVQRLTAAMRR